MNKDCLGLSNLEDQISFHDTALTEVGSDVGRVSYDQHRRAKRLLDVQRMISSLHSPSIEEKGMKGYIGSGKTQRNMSKDKWDRNAELGMNLNITALMIDPLSRTSYGRLCLGGHSSPG